MSDKLQGALNRLLVWEDDSQSRRLQDVTPTAKLVVAIVYIITMLSLPLTALSQLLIYAIFPMIAALIGDLSYKKIFVQSLSILPFVFLIAIFNPLFDRVPMFKVGGIIISRGWITFFSIIIRALLSTQATILLIASTGFISTCRALRVIGVPSIFVEQIALLYRYIFVIIEEAQNILRAKQARSPINTPLQLRLWGILVGQLLLRSEWRAQRVALAMRARGAENYLPAPLHKHGWKRKDTIFTILWVVVLIAIRVFGDIETAMQKIIAS